MHKILDFQTGQVKSEYLFLVSWTDWNEGVIVLLFSEWKMKEKEKV